MAKKGMITFPLGDYRNCIVLCHSCHAAFDRTSKTGWVFLPTDLQWVVDWEESDFVRRQKVFEQTGRRVDRKFPDEQDYESHMRATNALTDPDDGLCRGGLYNSYILERMFAPMMMEALEKQGLQIPGKHPQGPKRWHGAPMAAINRGFVVTGAPWMKLPEPEWELLHTLQRLYSRELPMSGVTEAETSGQACIASNVQSQGPAVHHSEPKQGDSYSAMPALIPAAPNNQCHHTGRQNALKSDHDFDSAIVLCSQGQGRLEKRGGKCDNADNNGCEYGIGSSLRSQSRTRQRLRTRERKALGVCEESWCFGPSSSSEDKVGKHIGQNGRVMQDSDVFAC